MSAVVLPNGVTIATEALVRRVSFDDTMLHCELRDGRIISVPLAWYPRLLRASAEQRNKWELIGGGTGIHWPMVDEDLPVRAFIAGCESPKSVSETGYALLDDIESTANQWQYTNPSDEVAERELELQLA